MEEGRYWVFDWLDSNGIRDNSDIESAVSRPSTFGNLIEEAQAVPYGETVEPMEGNLLVAGCGIDLSGNLDCFHHTCLSQQVDKLFRKAWHYFDRIVVNDTITPTLRDELHSRADPDGWLASQLKALLRIRELGAEGLVAFEEKGVACAIHYREHAEEADLNAALVAADELADEIAFEAKVSTFTNRRGTLGYRFDHPSFEHTNWGDLGDVDTPSTEGEAKRLVAHAVVRRYMAYLTKDVSFAKELKQPLGATIWAHTEILRRTKIAPTIDDIAMNLNLPVIDGVPVETLLKIRSDDRDVFERFRTSLRKASAEKIKLEDLSDANRMAAEIRQDLVEPELARIRSRLKAAEATLKRKAAFSGGLGILATACGVMTGVNPPVAVLAGVTTLAATQANAVGKYLDTKEEVSMSDMYFLWKAADHHSHNSKR